MCDFAYDEESELKRTGEKNATGYATVQSRFVYPTCGRKNPD